MGVYDNIEVLQRKRDSLKNDVKQQTTLYALSKDDLKKAEEWLRKAKKNKNRCYNDLKKTREALARVERKIKAHPSELRAYGRRNPFKAIGVDE